MSGKQLLMSVLQEGECGTYHLHMSVFLAALILHHLYQSGIPFVSLGHLVFIVAKSHQIIFPDAFCIHLICTDDILHLIHIYQICSHILPSEFFCYIHYP